MPRRVADTHSDVHNPIAVCSDDDFRQLSEALRRQQQLLKATHELFGRGVLQMDQQTGCVTGLNEACDVLGISREDTAESFDALLALVHPEDCDAFRAAIDTCSKSGTFRLTSRFCAADGSIHSVECNGTVLPGDSNLPSWLAVTMQNVVDGDQGNDVVGQIIEALHQQTGQDFFRSLTEHLVLACQTDYAMVAILNNDEEYTADAVAMSHRGELVDNICYQVRNTPCEKVIANGFCHFEANVQQDFPDDLLLSEIGIESYMGIPLLLSNGSSIGLIALLHTSQIPNPTLAEEILKVVAIRATAELEREHSYRQLSESREFTDRIVRASPHNLYVYDLTRKQLVYANRRVTEDLGYSIQDSTDLGSQFFFEAMHPEDRAKLPELLGRLANADDSTVIGTEYRIRDAQGHWHWYQHQDMVFSRNADGQVHEVIGCAQDITESKHLSEQLQDAQKMDAVGRLAGGIAHDFNNLLTVINSHCHILLSQMSAGHAHTRSVSSILEAGERAARLTRHLLTVSRRSVVEPEVLDINVVLQESRSLLQRLVGERVTISTSLAPGLPLIKVDRSQLDQAVMNIVLNARDATMNSGEILIRTEALLLSADKLPQAELPEGDFVRIVISDNGVGMSSDTLSRMFEPFFTTKGSDGTGLGLAIAHGCIVQNGGFVFAESEEGHGTTVSVYWPVTGEMVATAAPLSMPHGPSDAEVVLLVEDEQAVRNLLRIILKTDGYRVVVAAGAEEALKCFDRHRDEIRLLITDVVMPAMNGPELASRLRSEKPDLPILYMSGYTNDAIAELDLADFQAVFLQKPFTPSEFVAKVRGQINSAASG
ncbi:MAG TPA: response regulator [Planctomycetes bacterium]|nr:response regulator [Fuerstiella sp.]HIK93188.1 response regulator [Planctomycetota bacterium]